MSELSRRDFLKVGAKGIAVVGAGSAILQGCSGSDKQDETTPIPTNSPGQQQGKKDNVHITSQCSPPDAPERVGETGDYYIVCPSDAPEANREYSALIHVTIDSSNNRTESVELEGVDYYPFDGSYIEDTRPNNDVTAKDFYVCRSVCTDGTTSTAQSTAEAGGGTAQTLRKVSKKQSALRTSVALPAIKVTDKKVLKSIKVDVPNFTDTAGSKSLQCRLSTVEAHSDKSLKRPAHQSPSSNPSAPNYDPQDPDCKVVRTQGTSLSDVFNKTHTINGLKKAAYYVLIEVIYDYTDAAKPNDPLRRRGVSKWLFVDMRKKDKETDNTPPPK